MNTVLKCFLEKASQNEELKNKVMALNDMEKEEAVQMVVALAREAGYELTAEDILAMEQTEANGEMADDELENVAGGTNWMDGGICFGPGFGFGHGEVVAGREEADSDSERYKVDGVGACKYIGIGFMYGETIKKAF